MIEAESALEPLELLAHVRNVENRLGRERTVPQGPRTIDIDILFLAGIVIETPALVVPHPRAHERRFVLEPLAELAPDLRHPVLGLTVAALLAQTLDQGVRRTAFRLEVPRSSGRRGQVSGRGR